MSEFLPDPAKVLPDKESLLHAIQHPEEWFHTEEKWQTRSDFLITLIDRIEASGHYPYNADVRVLAHEELGLEPISYKDAHNEGNPLSWLIYKAQGYRRSDKLRADGYEPLTAELLERAAKMKAKVQIGTYLCTPKKVGDRWFAFKPRARTNAFLPNGAPVKIVA
jgi:hypothetical protein